jgi:hypothetical protein
MYQNLYIDTIRESNNYVYVNPGLIPRMTDDGRESPSSHSYEPRTIQHHCIKIVRYMDVHAFTKNFSANLTTLLQHGQSATTAAVSRARYPDLFIDAERGSTSNNSHRDVSSTRPRYHHFLEMANG